MVSDIKLGQATGAYAKTNQMDVGAGAVPSAEKAGFGDFLRDTVQNAIGDAHKNESVASQAIAGKQGITDLVTAINSTEMTINTVVAVRDRVIAAYQDIIKMPI